MKLSFIRRARSIARNIAQFERTLEAQRKAVAAFRAHAEIQLVAAADVQAQGAAGGHGRNLVLGLAAGYNRDDLAPFVESLRGSGFQGDIALATFGISSETSAYLASRQVTELPSDSLPFLGMSMNSARMLKYLEFIRTVLRSDSGYDYVMLADVRDIVFQGDPFRRTDGADIYYFLESDRAIGDCPINSAWMMQAFGAAVAKEVASSPVSCAGTLIAKPAALLSYLLRMVQCIADSPPQVRHSGIDQAIHNYLMANNLIANARVIRNGAAVMTVPSDGPSGMDVTPDGCLRNADESISEVVHQYDRDPVLLAAVRDRYQILRAH